MTAILFCGCRHVYARQKLNVDIRDRTSAIDIVAIATFLIIEKSRGSSFTS